MSRIPIKALKDMSKAYNLDHVIVYATEGQTQHIATYGRTITECSEAADFGNKMRSALGWPESLQAQPSRVRRLQVRLKEAEAIIEAQLKLEQAMYDTEIESAWPKESNSLINTYEKKYKIELGEYL